MPQVEFTIPYETKISPEIGAAHSRNIEWLLRMGLIETDEEVQQLKNDNTFTLGAYIAPDACGEDLDIAYNLMAWFGVFDDQFDSADPARVDRACRIAEELRGIVLSSCGDTLLTVSPSAPPLITAFLDLWRRMIEGMSPSWRVRAAIDWAAYLGSNVREAVDRRVGTEPAAQTHLDERRESAALLCCFQGNERISHLEVPLAAYHSTIMRQLRHFAMDQIILVAEPPALEHEDAAGTLNVVRLIMRQQDVTREKALSLVQDKADQLVVWFEKQAVDLPRLCDVLDLGHDGRRAVMASAESMRHWMRGFYEWTLTCDRYGIGRLHDISAGREALDRTAG